MSNAVSATAYYCAGTRMLDALRADTLLNDSLAARFMGDDGLSIFKNFSISRYRSALIRSAAT